MSFLLGDAYGSGSSSSDVESDDDAQTQQPEATAREVKSAVTLPSADSILESVSTATASFRAPHAISNQSSTQSIVEIDHFTEEEDAKAEKKEAQSKRRHEKEGACVPKVTVGTKRVAAAASAEAGSRDGAAKREKKDAKERVKAQRSKGQAGIGSDFRSWKSETEMQMRQQYD
uniref:Uncharacterized protein n=1 Tax=Globisporangium ultimum (strain ATCC 200006 / CBS 805.95 / DAOM BR144) TaxID=431595 RepID=K3WZ59_GLOUD